MASFSQLQKNFHATLLEFILQGLSQLCTLKLLSSDTKTAAWYELPSHSRKRQREARYSFYKKDFRNFSCEELCSLKKRHTRCIFFPKCM